MCKHGDTVDHEVTMPRVEVVDPVSGEAVLWEERRETVPLDRCIAPLVVALQAAGIGTLGSCCGHGKAPGTIILADGRWIMVVPDRASAAAAGALS